MATSLSLKNRRRAAVARRAAELAADIAQPPGAHIENLRGVLQLASTATLVGFLRTGIDARMMLGQQLCDRGLNQDGVWVGFAEAERLFLDAFPKARAMGVL